MMTTNPFEEKVFALCRNMKFGERYDYFDETKVKRPNVPIFLNAVNRFMDLNKGKLNYEFILDSGGLVKKRIALRKRKRVSIIHNTSNDKHPLALNVMKFQRYNFNFFTCEEAIFFEYVVIKGMSFNAIDWFYHSSETIRKETGIKKHSLSSIIKRFEELEILDVDVRGMPRVKHFRVNYPRIMELFDDIYQLTEGGKADAVFRKLLTDFFQPLAESFLQKNIKKE